MNEEEIKAYALAQGWEFMPHRLLACGGYWRDSKGCCFYAKQIQELVKPKKEKGK